jgi:glucosamine-phosphate N-acetyltransferase
MQRLRAVAENFKPPRDFSKYFKHYSNSEIELRELDYSDYDKNFFQTLGQLTKVEPVGLLEFVQTLNTIKHSTNLHLIIVAVLKSNGLIVGAGTVIIEQKFIRNMGKIGHIEDIVVDSSMRGKNLGRVIVECLTRIAMEEEQTYKVILDCSDKNTPFYEKLNFKKVQNNMAIYRENYIEKYLKIQ